MNEWLQTFAYHIDIGVWPFLAAVGVGLLTTWLTIAWQSISLAKMSPARVLKEG